MVVLGQGRGRLRAPQPVNLPSLRTENAGNDPRIALVPSGGSGWGAGAAKDDKGKVGKSWPAGSASPEDARVEVPSAPSEAKNPPSSDSRPKVELSASPGSSPWATPSAKPQEPPVPLGGLDPEFPSLGENVGLPVSSSSQPPLPHDSSLLSGKMSPGSGVQRAGESGAIKSDVEDSLLSSSIFRSGTLPNEELQLTALLKADSKTSLENPRSASRDSIDTLHRAATQDSSEAKRSDAGDSEWGSDFDNEEMDFEAPMTFADGSQLNPKELLQKQKEEEERKTAERFREQREMRLRVENARRRQLQRERQEMEDLEKRRHLEALGRRRDEEQQRLQRIETQNDYMKRLALEKMEQRRREEEQRRRQQYANAAAKLAQLEARIRERKRVQQEQHSVEDQERSRSDEVRRQELVQRKRESERQLEQFEEQQKEEERKRQEEADEKKRQEKERQEAYLKEKEERERQLHELELARQERERQRKEELGHEKRRVEMERQRCVAERQRLEAERQRLEVVVPQPVIEVGINSFKRGERYTHGVLWEDPSKQQSKARKADQTSSASSGKPSSSKGASPGQSRREAILPVQLLQRESTGSTAIQPPKKSPGDVKASSPQQHTTVETLGPASGVASLQKEYQASQAERQHARKVKVRSKSSRRTDDAPTKKSKPDARGRVAHSPKEPTSTSSSRRERARASDSMEKERREVRGRGEVRASREDRRARKPGKDVVRREGDQSFRNNRPQQRNTTDASQRTVRDMSKRAREEERKNNKLSGSDSRNKRVQTVSRYVPKEKDPHGFQAKKGEHPDTAAKEAGEGDARVTQSRSVSATELRRPAPRVAYVPKARRQAEAKEKDLTVVKDASAVVDAKLTEDLPSTNSAAKSALSELSKAVDVIEVGDAVKSLEKALSSSKKTLVDASSTLVSKQEISKIVGESRQLDLGSLEKGVDLTTLLSEEEMNYLHLKEIIPLPMGSNVVIIANQTGIEQNPDGEFIEIRSKRKKAQEKKQKAQLQLKKPVQKARKEAEGNRLAKERSRHKFQQRSSEDKSRKRVSTAKVPKSRASSAAPDRRFKQEPTQVKESRLEASQPQKVSKPPSSRAWKPKTDVNEREQAAAESPQAVIETSEPATANPLPKRTAVPVTQPAEVQDKSEDKHSKQEEEAWEGSFSPSHHLPSQLLESPTVSPPSTPVVGRGNSIRVVAKNANVIGQIPASQGYSQHYAPQFTQGNDQRVPHQPRQVYQQPLTAPPQAGADAYGYLERYGGAVLAAPPVSSPVSNQPPIVLYQPGGFGNVAAFGMNMPHPAFVQAQRKPQMRQAKDTSTNADQQAQYAHGFRSGDDPRHPTVYWTNVGFIQPPLGFVDYSQSQESKAPQQKAQPPLTSGEQEQQQQQLPRQQQPPKQRLQQQVHQQNTRQKRQQAQSFPQQATKSAPQRGSSARSTSKYAPKAQVKKVRESNSTSEDQTAKHKERRAKTKTPSINHHQNKYKGKRAGDKPSDVRDKKPTPFQAPYVPPSQRKPRAKRASSVATAVYVKKTVKSSTTAGQSSPSGSKAAQRTTQTA